MSTPSSLFVEIDENTKELIEVEMSKRAAHQLYEYLFPRLADIDVEFMDVFEVDYNIGSMLAIGTLKAKFFKPVYSLIMQACDEVESLKPFKAELKRVLEADKRFKESEWATA